jgi:hypothetical protein
MNFDEIKTLAANWYIPRMDERRTNFSRLVQAKLAEFAARGTAHSPPAYGAVEKLAFQEVERLGRMMPEGYQQALSAKSGVVEPPIVLGIKRDLKATLESEAVRIYAAIQYVREACKPASVTSAEDLPIRALQKLNADIDLLCAKLNTERGFADARPKVDLCYIHKLRRL